MSPSGARIPGRYTMVAFGGAGPVHAADFARRLGVKHLLIPPHAGVASALGMIVAPMSFDTVRTLPRRLKDSDPGELKRVFSEMGTECRSRMPTDVSADEFVDNLSLDMRYVGQGYYINIPIEAEALDTGNFPSGVVNAFNKVYTKLYGRVYDDLELEVVNLRTSVQGLARRINFVGDVASSGSANAEPAGRRLAFCPNAEKFVEHSIYRRGDLAPGFSTKGPAIVEENESTTIVGSDQSVVVDEHGSLIVSFEN